MISKRNLPIWLLHLAGALILVGSLLTWLTGEQGKLHLRQGIPTPLRSAFFFDSNGNYQTPSPAGEGWGGVLTLRSFEVIPYPGTDEPMDYRSVVEVEGNLYEVRMNHVLHLHGYRLCQSGYDTDLQGSYLSVNHDPWGIGFVYAGYALLLLAVAWLILAPPPAPPNNMSRYIPPSHYGEGLGVGLLLFVSFILCWAWMLDRQLMPVLRSPWLIFHVGTILLSYLLLILSFIWRRLLRSGVLLLAVGIALGSVWANVSWGSYWSWDPKETWALITLCIYAVPLHSRYLPWLRPLRNYRLYSLLALASLAMTYFGVTYLLGGLHSYA